MKQTLHTFTLVTLLFSVPYLAAAQGAQDLIINTVTFISTVVVPFLFGIAFLFFVWNAFRFFILGGANQESQEKAKSLAIYGVAAFVFLIIFWGVINLITTSIGLEDCAPIQSDYVTKDQTASELPPCGA